MVNRIVSITLMVLGILLITAGFAIGLPSYSSGEKECYDHRGSVIKGITCEGMIYSNPNVSEGTLASVIGLGAILFLFGWINFLFPIVRSYGT